MYPLETRQDFCCLHTGQQFGVPFDQLIIFSTNLNPHSLADEAFLRRIRHKIFIGYVTPNQYCRSFARFARISSMEYDEGHRLGYFEPLLCRHLPAPVRLPPPGSHREPGGPGPLPGTGAANSPPTELDSVCQSYFLKQADISNYDTISNIGDPRPLQ